MIEIVCDRDEKEKDMPWKELPKNVRQIGDTKEKRKIYIEDFVVTYLTKLARPNHVYARGAILLGKICRTEEGTAVFISGAMEAQNLELDMDETVFDDEIWRELLKERDRCFPGQDVVGWFLSRIGFSVEMNQKIVKVHLKNFPGNHKVLYMMDPLENEDAFYVSENRRLLRQSGYYIYYEKNSAMREYILSENGEEMRREEMDEKQEQLRRDKQVVQSYRKVSRYGKENKKQDARIRITRIASLFLIIGTLGYALYQIRGDEWMQKQGKEVVVETMSGTEERKEGKKHRMRVEKEQADPGQNNMEGYTEETGREEQGKEIPAEETRREQTGEETPSEEEMAGAASEEETGRETVKEETENGTAAGRETMTQDKPLYYIVQKGDTLAAISRKMYTSSVYAEQIAEVNHLQNQNEIYAGQKILIPSIR